MAETENFLRANIIDTVTYTQSIDMPTNIQVNLTENPFRDEEVIKDAEEIITYYKQGKLSVLSNPPTLDELTPSSSTLLPQDASPLPPDSSPLPPRDSSLLPLTDSPQLSRLSPQRSPQDIPILDDSSLPADINRDRKNATHLNDRPSVIQVERSIVEAEEPCDIETVVIPKKSRKCCVIQ